MNKQGSNVLTFPRYACIVHIRPYYREQCPYGACVVVDDGLNNSGSKFYRTPVFIKDI